MYEIFATLHNSEYLRVHGNGRAAQFRMFSTQITGDVAQFLTFMCARNWRRCTAPNIYIHRFIVDAA